MASPWLTLSSLVVVSVLLGWLHSIGGLAVDDGFIVLRYVSNLLEGSGLSYNAGERVEGFSSPLWVFILAGLEGFIRLFAAPDASRLEHLNRGLGVVFGAGATVATFFFTRARFRVPVVYQVGAAAGVVLSWPILFWSGAGLETSLVALLLVLTAQRMSGAEPFAAQRRLSSVALLTALSLSRPEGPLFVLVATATGLHRTPAGQRRQALLALAGGAGVYLVLLIARLLYYGELLPNTYHAKVGGGPYVLLRGAYYVYDYLSRGGGALLALLAVVGMVTTFLRERAEGGRMALMRVPGLPLLTAGFVFILLVGGDGLYCFRFIAHVLPLLWALAARGAHAIHLGVASVRAGGKYDLVRLLRAAARGSAPLLGPGLLAFSVYRALLPQLDDESLLYGARNWRVKQSEAGWTELGRALRADLPDDALLATNVAGKVPYESRLPTLDMLGLTDPVVAKTRVSTMGRGYAGHEKADAAYVAERRPAVIFLSVLENLPFEVFRDVAQSGPILRSTVLGAYADLLMSPSFLRAYAPAQVPRSGAEAAPVLIRRDVAQRLAPDSRVRVSEWLELGAGGSHL